MVRCCIFLCILQWLDIFSQASHAESRDPGQAINEQLQLPQLNVNTNDPNSFSNPEEVRVNHMDLKWNLDFGRKVVSGTVDYDIVIEKPETNCLILDSRNLTIHSIKSSSGAALNYSFGQPLLTFGQPLIIDISGLILGQPPLRLRIEYETAPNCFAMQWMEEEQTAGKKNPYVFSECWPLHCRSLLPCQDTPTNKATYTAEVTVPKRLQAVMSAVISNETEIIGDLKKYKFEQKIPVVSYLIAIAVGNIHGKRVGPRVTVWTEPELLDAAAYEFAETEDHLKIAESVLGEYVWGVYDILVLPPSFIFGGMENPCLTYVTPTLLAGDRSLVTLVYHEISHSWSGNLVTNKNFEHLWLNEGFTVYGERKILSVIKGEHYRQLASISGLKRLADTIETMKPDNPLTNLVQNLTGIDPDDAFSKVPYEKGYTFLYYLQEKVGGTEIFESFVRKYLEINRFKSIDTDKFRSDFVTYFTNLGKVKEIEDIDWDAWLYTPGMPLIIPKYDTTLSEACDQLRDRWVQWDKSTSPPFTKEDFHSLIPPQQIEFMNLMLEIKPTLPIEKVKVLQEVYDLNSIKNSEIRLRWLRLGILARWVDQVALALAFVTEQGRLSLIRPIYRELYAWEEVRQRTIDHFQKTRSGMMHAGARQIAKDLHLPH